jgi:shikimate kinase
MQLIFVDWYKSTLAHHLMQRLQNNWTLIDRDQVIERYEQRLIERLKSGDRLVDPWELRKRHRSEFDSIEAHADEYLIQEIEDQLRLGKGVIVDTQLPLTSCTALRVLVYSPLEVLIERDKHRSQRLTRPAQRQYYARAFLFENFVSLYDLEISKKKGPELDTLLLAPLKEEILPFFKIAAIAEFFSSHLQIEQPLYLYPKAAPDVIIRSDLQTVEESVQSLFIKLF